MLVLNAHNVTDTSGEGFAVRLFRKGNQRGFIRALSDQPSFFAAGFNKVSHHCSAPYTQLRGSLITKRFLASVLQPTHLAYDLQQIWATLMHMILPDEMESEVLGACRLRRS